MLRRASHILLRSGALSPMLVRLIRVFPQIGGTPFIPCMFGIPHTAKRVPGFVVGHISEVAPGRHSDETLILVGAEYHKLKILIYNHGSIFI